MGVSALAACPLPPPRRARDRGGRAANGHQWWLLETCVDSASHGDTAAAPHERPVPAPRGRPRGTVTPNSPSAPQRPGMGSELCTPAFPGGPDRAAPCGVLWMWVISGTRRCAELWRLVPHTTLPRQFWESPGSSSWVRTFRENSRRVSGGIIKGFVPLPHPAPTPPAALSSNLHVAKIYKRRMATEN